MKLQSILLLVATSSALTLRKSFPADVQDANPNFPKDVHEMTPLSGHDNHTWGPLDNNKASYPITQQGPNQENQRN